MTIRKYRKLNINTYNPKRKLKITSQEAVPMAIDVGTHFSRLGGLIGFFINSFLMSWKTMRRTKKRFREVKRRFEKTIDLTE